MCFLMFIRLFFYFMFFFFFNDPATTEIYTLSLHDALPICAAPAALRGPRPDVRGADGPRRSEEHTSELQSPYDLVCRLLLEKKNINIKLAVCAVFIQDVLCVLFEACVK